MSSSLERPELSDDSFGLVPINVFIISLVSLVLKAISAFGFKPKISGLSISGNISI